MYEPGDRVVGCLALPAVELAAHPGDIETLATVPGTYREAGRVSGDQAFEAVRPFPVRVVPADLSR